MSRVVLFFKHGGPLYLESVRRNASGEVTSGFVINGYWNFQMKNGKVLAKNGKHIVTQWPDEIVKTVEISADERRDYNFVIADAEAA